MSLICLGAVSQQSWFCVFFLFLLFHKFSNMTPLASRVLARTNSALPLLCHRIFPKSISVERLFGTVNAETAAWEDGLLSSTVRNTMADKYQMPSLGGGWRHPLFYYYYIILIMNVIVKLPETTITNSHFCCPPPYFFFILIFIRIMMLHLFIWLFLILLYFILWLFYYYVFILHLQRPPLPTSVLLQCSEPSKMKTTLNLSRGRDVI